MLAQEYHTPLSLYCQLASQQYQRLLERETGIALKICHSEL